MTVRGRGIDLDTYSLASAVITSEVSITATTSATGNVCMTLGPFTVDNNGTFLFECFVPYLTKGTTNLDIELWEGTPGTGTLLTTLTGHLAASVVSPSQLSARLSLNSGSHTIKVAGFVDAGTGKFGANNGATGNPPNAFAYVTPA